MESQLAEAVANANHFAHLAASYPSDISRAEWQKAANAFAQAANGWKEAIALRQKDLESYK